MGRNDETNSYTEGLRKELLRTERIEGTDLTIQAALGSSEELNATDYEIATKLKEKIIKELSKNKTITIGRQDISQTLDPRANEAWEAMSNKHVRVSVVGGYIKVTDLESTNGTIAKDGAAGTFEKLKGTTSVFDKDRMKSAVIGVPILSVSPEDCFVFKIEKSEAVVKQEIKRERDSGHYSERSTTHPDRNDDRAIDEPDINLYGVLDGVGSGDLGYFASQKSVEYITKHFRQFKSNDTEKIEDAMKTAILGASREVTEQSVRSPEFKDSSTTVNLVYLAESNAEKTATIGNVGDSRTYLWRNGKIKQVTKDHDVINSYGSRQGWEDIDIRWIQQQLTNAKSEEDVLAIENSKIMNELNNPLNRRALLNLWNERKFSNIYQSVGNTITEVAPQIKTIGVKSGDIIISVTDGVIGSSDNLTENELLDIINKSQKQNASQISKNVVGAAKEVSEKNSFRSKPDDMTAVIVKVA